MTNAYIPFSSRVEKVIRHTDIEYTFRMSFSGAVKPGQFFEISMPQIRGSPHIRQRNRGKHGGSDDPEGGAGHRSDF